MTLTAYSTLNRKKSRHLVNIPTDFKHSSNSYNSYIPSSGWPAIDHICFFYYFLVQRAVKRGWYYQKYEKTLLFGQHAVYRKNYLFHSLGSKISFLKLFINFYRNTNISENFRKSAHVFHLSCVRTMSFIKSLWSDILFLTNSTWLVAGLQLYLFVFYWWCILFVVIFPTLQQIFRNFIFYFRRFNLTILGLSNIRHNWQTFARRAYFFKCLRLRYRGISRWGLYAIVHFSSYVIFLKAFYRNFRSIRYALWTFFSFGLVPIFRTHDLNIPSLANVDLTVLHSNTLEAGTITYDRAYLFDGFANWSSRYSWEREIRDFINFRIPDYLSLKHNYHTDLAQWIEFLYNYPLTVERVRSNRFELFFFCELVEYLKRASERDPYVLMRFILDTTERNRLMGRFLKEEFLTIIDNRLLRESSDMVLRHELLSTSFTNVESTVPFFDSRFEFLFYYLQTFTWIWWENFILFFQCNYAISAWLADFDFNASDFFFVTRPTGYLFGFLALFFSVVFVMAGRHVFIKGETLIFLDDTTEVVAYTPFGLRLRCYWDSFWGTSIVGHPTLPWIVQPDEGFDDMALRVRRADRMQEMEWTGEEDPDEEHVPSDRPYELLLIFLTGCFLKVYYPISVPWLSGIYRHQVLLLSNYAYDLYDYRVATSSGIATFDFTGQKIERLNDTPLVSLRKMDSERPLYRDNSNYVMDPLDFVDLIEDQYTPHEIDEQESWYQNYLIANELDELSLDEWFENIESVTQLAGSIHDIFNRFDLPCEFPGGMVPGAFTVLPDLPWMYPFIFRRLLLANPEKKVLVDFSAILDLEFARHEKFPVTEYTKTLAPVLWRRLPEFLLEFLDRSVFAGELRHHRQLVLEPEYTVWSRQWLLHKTIYPVTVFRELVKGMEYYYKHGFLIDILRNYRPVRPTLIPQENVFDTIYALNVRKPKLLFWSDKTTMSALFRKMYQAPAVLTLRNELTTGEKRYSVYSRHHLKKVLVELFSNFSVTTDKKLVLPKHFFFLNFSSRSRLILDSNKNIRFPRTRANIFIMPNFGGEGFSFYDAKNNYSWMQMENMLDWHSYHDGEELVLNAAESYIGIFAILEQYRQKQRRPFSVDINSKNVSNFFDVPLSRPALTYRFAAPRYVLGSMQKVFIPSASDLVDAENSRHEDEYFEDYTPIASFRERIHGDVAYFADLKTFSEFQNAFDFDIDFEKLERLSIGQRRQFPFSTDSFVIRQWLTAESNQPRMDSYSEGDHPDALELTRFSVGEDEWVYTPLADPSSTYLERFREESVFDRRLNPRSLISDLTPFNDTDFSNHIASIPLVFPKAQNYDMVGDYFGSRTFQHFYQQSVFFARQDFEKRLMFSNQLYGAYSRFPGIEEHAPERFSLSEPLGSFIHDRQFCQYFVDFLDEGGDGRTQYNNTRFFAANARLLPWSFHYYDQLLLHTTTSINPNSFLFDENVEEQDEMDEDWSYEDSIDMVDFNDSPKGRIFELLEDEDSVYKIDELFYAEDLYNDLAQISFFWDNALGDWFFPVSLPRELISESDWEGDPLWWAAFSEDRLDFYATSFPDLLNDIQRATFMQQADNVDGLFSLTTEQFLVVSGDMSVIADLTTRLSGFSELETGEYSGTEDDEVEILFEGASWGENISLTLGEIDNSEEPDSIWDFMFYDVATVDYIDIPTDSFLDGGFADDPDETLTVFDYRSSGLESGVMPGVSISKISRFRIDPITFSFGSRDSELEQLGLRLLAQKALPEEGKVSADRYPRAVFSQWQTLFVRHLQLRGLSHMVGDLPYGAFPRTYWWGIPALDSLFWFRDFEKNFLSFASKFLKLFRYSFMLQGEWTEKAQGDFHFWLQSMQTDYRQSLLRNFAFFLEWATARAHADPAYLPLYNLILDFHARLDYVLMHRHAPMEVAVLEEFLDDFIYFYLCFLDWWFRTNPSELQEFADSDLSVWTFALEEFGTENARVLEKLEELGYLNIKFSDLKEKNLFSKLNKDCAGMNNDALFGFILASRLSLPWSATLNFSSPVHHSIRQELPFFLKRIHRDYDRYFTILYETFGLVDDQNAQKMFLNWFNNLTSLIEQGKQDKELLVASSAAYDAYKVWDLDTAFQLQLSVVDSIFGDEEMEILSDFDHSRHFQDLLLANSNSFYIQGLVSSAQASYSTVRDFFFNQIWEPLSEEIIREYETENVSAVVPPFKKLINLRSESFRKFQSSQFLDPRFASNYYYQRLPYYFSPVNFQYDYKLVRPNSYRFTSQWLFPDTDVLADGSVFDTIYYQDFLDYEDYLDQLGKTFSESRDVMMWWSNFFELSPSLVKTIQWELDSADDILSNVAEHAVFDDWFDHYDDESEEEEEKWEGSSDAEDEVGVFNNPKLLWQDVATSTLDELATDLIEDDWDDLESEQDLVYNDDYMMWQVMTEGLDDNYDEDMAVQLEFVWRSFRDPLALFSYQSATTVQEDLDEDEDNFDDEFEFEDYDDDQDGIDLFASADDNYRLITEVVEAGPEAQVLWHGDTVEKNIHEEEYYRHYLVQLHRLNLKQYAIYRDTRLLATYSKGHPYGKLYGLQTTNNKVSHLSLPGLSLPSSQNRAIDDTNTLRGNVFPGADLPDVGSLTRDQYTQWQISGGLDVGTAFEREFYIKSLLVEGFNIVPGSFFYDFIFLVGFWWTSWFELFTFMVGPFYPGGFFWSRLYGSGNGNFMEWDSSFSDERTEEKTLVREIDDFFDSAGQLYLEKMNPYSFYLWQLSQSSDFQHYSEARQGLWRGYSNPHYFLDHLWSVFDDDHTRIKPYFYLSSLKVRRQLNLLFYQQMGAEVASKIRFANVGLAYDEKMMAAPDEDEHGRNERKREEERRAKIAYFMTNRDVPLPPQYRPEEDAVREFERTLALRGIRPLSGLPLDAHTNTPSVREALSLSSHHRQRRVTITTQVALNALRRFSHNFPLALIMRRHSTDNLTYVPPFFQEPISQFLMFFPRRLPLPVPILSSYRVGLVKNAEGLLEFRAPRIPVRAPLPADLPDDHPTISRAIVGEFNGFQRLTRAAESVVLPRLSQDLNQRIRQQANYQRDWLIGYVSLMEPIMEDQWNRHGDFLEDPAAERAERIEHYNIELRTLQLVLREHRARRLKLEAVWHRIERERSAYQLPDLTAWTPVIQRRQQPENSRVVYERFLKMAEYERNEGLLNEYPIREPLRLYPLTNPVDASISYLNSMYKRLISSYLDHHSSPLLTNPLFMRLARSESRYWRILKQGLGPERAIFNHFDSYIAGLFPSTGQLWREHEPYRRAEIARMKEGTLEMFQLLASPHADPGSHNTRYIAEVLTTPRLISALRVPRITGPFSYEEWHPQYLKLLQDLRVKIQSGSTSDLDTWVNNHLYRLGTPWGSRLTRGEIFQQIMNFAGECLLGYSNPPIPPIPYDFTPDPREMPILRRRWIAQYESILQNVRSQVREQGLANASVWINRELDRIGLPEGMPFSRQDFYNDLFAVARDYSESLVLGRLPRIPDNLLQYTVDPLTSGLSRRAVSTLVGFEDPGYVSDQSSVGVAEDSDSSIPFVPLSHEELVQLLEPVDPQPAENELSDEEEDRKFNFPSLTPEEHAELIKLLEPIDIQPVHPSASDVEDSDSSIPFVPLSHEELVQLLEPVDPQPAENELSDEEEDRKLSQQQQRLYDEEMRGNRWRPPIEHHEAIQLIEPLEDTNILDNKEIFGDAPLLQAAPPLPVAHQPNPVNPLPVVQIELPIVDLRSPRSQMADLVSAPMPEVPSSAPRVAPRSSAPMPEVPSSAPRAAPRPEMLDEERAWSMRYDHLQRVIRERVQSGYLEDIGVWIEEEIRRIGIPPGLNLKDLHHDLVRYAEDCLEFSPAPRVAPRSSAPMPEVPPSAPRAILFSLEDQKIREEEEKKRSDEEWMSQLSDQLAASRQRIEARLQQWSGGRTSVEDSDDDRYEQDFQDSVESKLAALEQEARQRRARTSSAPRVAPRSSAPMPEVPPSAPRAAPQPGQFRQEAAERMVMFTSTPSLMYQAPVESSSRAERPPVDPSLILTGSSSFEDALSVVRRTAQMQREERLQQHEQRVLQQEQRISQQLAELTVDYLSARNQAQSDEERVALKETYTAAVRELTQERLRLRSLEPASVVSERQHAEGTDEEKEMRFLYRRVLRAHRPRRRRQ